MNPTTTDLEPIKLKLEETALPAVPPPDEEIPMLCDRLFDIDQILAQDEAALGQNPPPPSAKP